MAQQHAFDIVQSDMIQILGLHCGSCQHWIVLASTCNINIPKDIVYIFNFFDEDIPNDTIEQIASILHSKALQITVVCLL